MSENTFLPSGGFLRLPAVLRLIPVGKSTWWAGIKSGRFPKGVKLGRNTTAWRSEDIQKLLQSFGEGALNGTASGKPQNLLRGSATQNDSDNKAEGQQAISQGRLRRRAPETPASDAAKTRQEDSFGKPLDALYLSPPEGIEAAEASIVRVRRIRSANAANYTRNEIRTGGSEAIAERAGRRTFVVRVEAMARSEDRL